jgi:SAM-dependent methyltransferase
MVGDVHELPFRDGSFASYLSFGVLEHFPFGPEPALREAHRVLRNGGVAVLTVPYPNLVWRMVRAKRALVRHREPDGYYETTYRVGQLERTLTRTGFDVLLRRPIGHSFTLWGLGGAFRGRGYYETSALAERLGAACAALLPWSTGFASLIVARKGRTTPRDGET